MRILHYLSEVRLAHGGVCRAVLDLCGVLAARGHDVALATWDPFDAPPEWRGTAPGRPRLIDLPRPARPAGLFGPAARRRISAAVRDADAVHLHVPWDLSNVQFAAACRRERKPYILSVHGMLDDWCMATRPLKKRIYLALAGRRLLERAAYYHCTAEAERDQASKWAPRGRGAVIPLVLDLAPYRSLPGAAPARPRFPALADQSPVVLFLSRIHLKKGVDVLIEATALLRDRGARCRTLIAGPGEPEYERRMSALVDERGLRDRVEFLGMVVGVEKVSLYQSADVFVLPTSQENFGFVLVEALACGTPVITTRGVDIWPELEQSGGALIVDRDPRAIADAIAGLLSEPSRRQEMAVRGRQWVLDRLDGDRVAAEYESLYASAAGGA